MNASELAASNAWWRPHRAAWDNSAWAHRNIAWTQLVPSKRSGLHPKWKCAVRRCSSSFPWSSISWSADSFSGISSRDTRSAADTNCFRSIGDENRRLSIRRRLSPSTCLSFTPNCLTTSAKNSTGNSSNYNCSNNNMVNSSSCRPIRLFY